MAEGQLRWENKNLTSAENLKLVTAQKPTFNSSILVAYPRLNQGEWISPLVHSQHKLDSVEGGEVQGQRKIYSIYGVFNKKKKIKRNLLESNSENEEADFLRFFVIESLEEFYLAKLSPFLIEKFISTRATPKTVKKTRNGNLLVEVDSRRATENIFKMKTFHPTKYRAYPLVKLNISKGVIRSRELALATEEEIASALGKQT